MALFTDQGVVALDDLLQFENSVGQVSSSHGIDVNTKINLSVNAIGDKLLLWLLNMGASDPQWMNRRLIGLSSVVVTPALYRWVCFDSLSRFFAEAYNAQLNTRFQSKWTEYQGEARNTADMAFATGLGLVYNPLAKPAAPTTATVSGSTPSQTLYLQTTWIDRQGAESAPGIVAGISLNGTTSLSVLAVGSASVVPSTAVGWNVYASSQTVNLQLQNNVPISIGSRWTLPVSGLVSGRIAGAGQTPNIYLQLAKQIQRG